MKLSKTRPTTWIPTLYFAMGMPFIVLNMVSVLAFKGMGVSDAQIALWTSLIMIPWSLKFLWSPFLEMYKSKRFFAITTQLIAGVGFILIGLSLQLPFFFACAISLMSLVALSGATHDVVTDGIYIAELDKAQQAKYIGWQGAFYNLAKIVATGGLVWLAGWLFSYFLGQNNGVQIAEKAATIKSWTYIFFILGAIMGLIALYHWFVLPKGGEQKKITSGKESLLELKAVLLDFFKKANIIYYIFFIVLYRFAEGFAIKIVPLFLKAERAIGGLGLNEQEIGVYYGTYGAASFVLGSMLGGYYISKFGLQKTLFHLCMAFNLPFIAYALLAIYQPFNVFLIGGAVAIEYFGYGFGFVGLIIFMMQQIAVGKHPMAHYAFASAIMNLGVMLPGAISGFISDYLGYMHFFIFILVATIPAFLITYFVPFTYPDKKSNE
ncbi:MAG: MFS transporter [Bacteroidales bacterium]